MNFHDIADNIEQREGVWYAKTQSSVSYPSDATSIYFEIEENSFWFKHRNDCITTLVKNYSPKSVFFDIGGGNGFVSKGLQNAGIEVVLVEPSALGVNNAFKRRHIKNVVCSTLDDAHFKPESIPAAGLFDVIEHIEDDTAFLHNLHRYISPNGYLYTTVPTYQWLFSKFDTEAGHYRRYTKTSFDKLLAAAGFKLMYGTYIFRLLPLPIFLTRTLPSKIGAQKLFLNESVQKDQHGTKKGLLTQLANPLWQSELKNIELLKPMSFGGSYLAVAKKR
ncbi:MAG: class I SAM-dependent methyltransferase [Cytophagales bacterium]|nr:MAG: class I SAM-dependent methyltransferase [Cytophagales bacterium]TAF59766.1 MAG: class I SAM-dependent methyltransferase [Cytophagales bacterium]